jgi:hypothetical protein
MPSEGRAIPYEPAVPKRIREAPLAVPPPRHGVIANRVSLGQGTGGNGPRHERIRVIAEDLDPGRRHAKMRRVVPAVVLRLAHEERRARDRETPMTEPRFHNPSAPRARQYHSAARGALGTASMTVITGW